MMTKKTLVMLERLLAGLMLIVLITVITGDLGWHQLTLPMDLTYVLLLFSASCLFIEDKKKALEKEKENHV